MLDTLFQSQSIGRRVSQVNFNVLDPETKDHPLSKEDLQASLQKDPDSTDRLLSKTLLQLSLKDRNVIDEEIHGIAILAPKENPDFLEASLEELSGEIDKIPDNNPLKAAYIESQMLPKTYVNTADFRLRFLRCELFDAKKAANRMMKFLNLAWDLGGPEILERPMTMNDLTREEKKYMAAGYIQALPYRERSGRPIIAQVGNFDLLEGATRLRAKVELYFFYAMSDNVENQQKGLTVLIWAGCTKFDYNTPSAQELLYRKAIPETIPLRLSVIHFCFPDKSVWKILSAGMILVLNRSMRSRVKFHTGEDLELRYQLKTYGIPAEFIPVTETGNIKTLYHKQFLKGRKELEDRRVGGKHEESIVVYPSSNDVLFRRGQTLACHPGNSAYQDMIELRMLDHANAAQAEKKLITDSIIKVVLDRGGRFLEWNKKGWWVDLKDSTQIHIKVANQIKLFKFKPSVATNTQKVRSSTFLFQNQDLKRRKIQHEYSSDSDNSVNGDCACWAR